MPKTDDDRLVRDRLNKAIADLESIKDTGDAAAAVVELDQTRVGRLSRMDAMQSQAMSAAAQQRQRARIVSLKLAIKRLDSDDYGDCLSCGEPIDPRRLDYDPAVARCIGCQEEHDSDQG